LELKIGSQVYKASGVDESLPVLNQALEYAQAKLREGGVIEPECDSNGKTMALSLDWRQVRNRQESRMMVEKILAFCKKRSLKIIEYPGQPCLDVYPCDIDKGKALVTLKEKLGLSGGVLYMGYSPVDNAAFKEADVSIGVTRNEKAPDLDCRYGIKFEDVVLCQH